MRRDPPCKDCTDRHATCHAACKLYAAWCKELKAHKAKEYAYKRAHGDVTAIEGDARMRFARRDSLKRKVGQR